MGLGACAPLASGGVSIVPLAGAGAGWEIQAQLITASLESPVRGRIYKHTEETGCKHSAPRAQARLGLGGTRGHAPPTPPPSPGMVATPGGGWDEMGRDGVDGMQCGRMGWMGWGPHCDGCGRCRGARVHVFFLLELRECCVHDICVWSVSIFVSPPCRLHRASAMPWCHLPRHSGVKCQQCGDTEASVHEPLSVSDSEPLRAGGHVGLGNAPWRVKWCQLVAGTVAGQWGQGCFVLSATVMPGHRKTSRAGPRNGAAGWDGAPLAAGRQPIR